MFMTLSRQLAFYNIDTGGDADVVSGRYELCEVFKDGEKYLVIKGTRIGAPASLLVQSGSLLGITLEQEPAEPVSPQDPNNELPDGIAYG